MKRETYATFVAITAILAFAVITFGAYVRLSDAGLGCPDWPGCYGQLTVPENKTDIEKANADYPQRQVEPEKAWKEMYHRYLATGLGILILFLAIVAGMSRHNGIPLSLPIILVAMVIFQGLLGMWTVTLLVKPLVVTAHLAGGLITLILLWWLLLRTGKFINSNTDPLFAKLCPWVVFGIVLLTIQILLGGWTSTNYAAAACIEFPTCYGSMWWPPTNFEEAFKLWRGLGVNYEFGVLDNPARTAIHLAHRVGALVVLVYLLILSVQIMQRAKNVIHANLGAALHVLLLLQIGLGIAVVLNYRQLPVAVAHNAGAALLLIILFTLLYILKPQQSEQAT